MTKISKKSQFITFIGAGNMASALIGGLLAQGYDAKKICATSPDLKSLAKIKRKFKINTATENRKAAMQATILILAVKPQQLFEVVTELADIIKQKKLLVVSIAAMVPIAHIEKWLLGKTAVIRCMPNTPALVRCGATALCPNQFVKPAQKKIAEKILQSVGLTVWLKNEKLMDLVTVLSGSGPAYFFYLMEILQDTAIKMGLPRETARLLTLQTALGAAKLAVDSPHDAAVLRQQVTSKKGVTERAFELLDAAKMPDAFFKAFTAACQRSSEVAEELGRQ